MWKFLIGIALVLLCTGCATRSPLIGWIYTDVDSPTLVTPQVNLKTGESCASSILGMVATGDASQATAARNGNITSIGAVDEENMSILGIYSKHCTMVHGR